MQQDPETVLRRIYPIMIQVIRREELKRQGGFMEEVTFAFGLEEKVGSTRQRRGTGALAPT